LAREVSLATQTIRTDSYLELCDKNQIDVLTCFCDEYPKPLVELHNPPTILFKQGQFLETDTLAIAIVGTRHATPYGKRVAEQLARGLASAGYTIVSGLARGIDAAAHKGAIEAGGRTIGVLASGLLNIYPAEHVKLAQQVRDQGALVSESAPNHPPKSGSFPQRNRIISGLSLGTIVIEAAQRSGALITARLAMEQGREVFAVPGPIDSRVSKGCHELIKDGATLVGSIDDILEQLGPLAKPIESKDGEKIHHPGELKLNEQEMLVLNSIPQMPIEIDAIVDATELPIARVLSTISVLEIRRLIRRISGTQVARV
jgi:DNA processing protein